GITQQKGFNFTIDKIKEGKNNFKLRIYNEHISDERDIEIIGLDEPKLSISSLEYPINVSYKDEFSINYIIKKGSNSTAYNVVIKVYGPAFEKIYSLGNLEESENKSVNLRGNQLNIGENKFVIDLAYEDGNKRKYNEKEEITVNLSNVTFFQKMMIFLRNLFK
ncbi:MAG: hypothetical protein N3D84_03905, partial [Candidatus Woesearchaeota archaeon]|nr:hypothetical protein [Candidatus Woesearchaeota archaeon]